MRIVFFMAHAGYSRNFESTIRELAQRGHHVWVLLDRVKKNLDGAQGALLAGLAEEFEHVHVGQAPHRGLRKYREASARLRLAIDFSRYLDPAFAEADSLRERAESRAPAAARAVLRLPGMQRPARLRAFQRALIDLDRATPSAPEVVRTLDKLRPDVVLVTPLLEIGCPQLDYVRAARRKGIPTGLLVASWDNLTTKGLVQEHLDFLTVWNVAQRREAADLHDIDPETVVVTGASPYDHWFTWEVSRDRETFCAEVGLDPARPFLLYLGSSEFIAPNESEYLVDWVGRLRREGGPIADVQVLVRPHPTNPLADGSPAGEQLLGLPGVQVWPRAGANPTDRSSRADYFDSMRHGAAVVGINTSGLIESGIAGRSVFTLLDERNSGTQEGTLHFHHLLHENGGLLHVARTFEEHVAQLAQAIADPEAAEAHNRAFIERFIRPHGLDVPATPLVVQAIEEAAERRPAPLPDVPRLPVKRRLLRGLAAYEERRVKGLGLGTRPAEAMARVRRIARREGAAG